MVKIKLYKSIRKNIGSHTDGLDGYVKFIKQQALQHINNPAFEPIFLSIMHKKDIESTSGPMLKLRLTTDIDDPNRDVVACYRINEYLAFYYSGEIYLTAFAYDRHTHRDRPALLLPINSRDKTIYRLVELDHITKSSKPQFFDPIKVITAFVFKSD